MNALSWSLLILWAQLFRQLLLKGQCAQTVLPVQEEGLGTRNQASLGISIRIGLLTDTSGEGGGRLGIFKIRDLKAPIPPRPASAHLTTTTPAHARIFKNSFKKKKNFSESNTWCANCVQARALRTSPLYHSQSSQLGGS